MNKLQVIAKMQKDLLAYIVTEIGTCPVDVSVEIHFFRPSEEILKEAKQTPGFIKYDEYLEYGKNYDGGGITLYL